MQPNVKKVAAIHDLSGFGRASLTTIIPTLSSMSVQVCPVPTAILSTHSGGFTHYSFTDLTDSMPSYIAHWKSLDLTFDGIYSGFLGSPQQTEIVSQIIKDFAVKDGKKNGKPIPYMNNTLVVVDPVMGDDGHLYRSVNPLMIPHMRRLIQQADIIVPNITEACLLLDCDIPQTLGREGTKSMLKRLSDLGPACVVITSLPDEEHGAHLCTAAYQRETNSYWRIVSDTLPGSYPGTGDTFASVMIGSLLQGESLPVSIDRATQFIAQCINASRGYDYPHRDGILLERELYLLREPWTISCYEEL